MDTRIWPKAWALLAVIATVLAVLGAPAAASPPGDITEYPVPTQDFGGPDEITAGPDGNLWFTAVGSSNIGRITPTGTVTAFPLRLAQAEAIRGITTGSDGNLWFTANFYANGQLIGRMTPTGTVTEFPLPTTAYPGGITAGPDGNMWFTEVQVTSGPGCFGCPLAMAIGRITPAGAITEYPLATPATAGTMAGSIAAADGNLWFTWTGGMGRITTQGTITEYPLPAASSDLGGIAAGPDGNLWFTRTGGIGRITPQGTTEYSLSRPDSHPGGIAAGPDGNMWFTEFRTRITQRRGTVFLGSAIGRITPAGTITEYPLPKADSVPSGITAGPDGNMWFTEMKGERIGRISPDATPGAVTYPCPVNVTPRKPTPKTLGNQVLTDRITTNTSCLLRKPVVLCRPLASSAAGERAFCETKATARGQIRVRTHGSQAMRITVIVRATPKPGRADTWKPATWRKNWTLKQPTAARSPGEMDLTLSKGLMQTMDAAGVDITAIRGAGLSPSGVVTFRVTGVQGDVITTKGALKFSSSAGFVTMQNIALNYKAGKAAALVEATAVPNGIQIADLLTFTGGTNGITQNGTWKSAKVALATSTAPGDPARLFAGQLGLPSGTIPSGMVIGRATITGQ